MALDLRTVMFIYGIVNIICAGAMIIIWYQSRKTLAGTGFWAMDMILQAVGAILITVRGLVPDLFSIVLANVMISGGIILIYMGLERFAGAISRQIHNYVLLAIFAFMLIYFTYAQPDLMPRQIGIDVATTIFTFQAFWLMVHRVSTHMRAITRIVGIVFGCYALASFARIILHIFFPPQGNDFFKSGLADTLAIVVYTMLAVALVFSLTLMVNRRLLGEVKSQEEKFTSAFKSSPYAIALTMPADGRILEFNDSFLTITGYQYAEVMGKSTVDLHLWAREEDRKTVVRELSRGNKVQGLEVQFRKKSGELLTGLFYADIITVNNQKCVLSSISDITERKRLEQALMQEKKRIEVTIHSTGDGVIATDMEGRVTLLNRVAEELTGWTQQQAMGKPIHEVFNIIDERTRNPIANPVDEAIKTGKVINLSNHAILVSRDGTERIIADSGAPIKDDAGNFFGAVLIFRDITHLQKLEEEALKIAKLESVGTLAGGIAHDFNNILTGILGNINLAKMETNTTGKIRELLQEAETASLRAATLTKQLLTFAKGGAPIRKPVALAQVIRDTATLAGRGSDMRCRCSIAPDLWPVDADEGQISQVITNIVLNAKQAMPDGGAVEVDAINMYLSQEQSLGKKLPLTEGNYIRIAITDHGTGIDAEHLDKVFDPYFTTKPKGSGLGLSTSFSIIKKHDGHISVESEVSKGSTFYIYLPASREQVPAPAIKENKVAAGKGRILVMDDEDVIRDVAGRMLKQIGYQDIELARDGAEAIQKYQQGMDSGNPFAAVILDLTIPGGMGGVKAIEKLLEIDPKVKAVICSGYTDSAAMAEYRNYGFKGVIPKPFTTADLSKTLSDVISR